MIVPTLLISFRTEIMCPRASVPVSSHSPRASYHQLDIMGECLMQLWLQWLGISSHERSVYGMVLAFKSNCRIETRGLFLWPGVTTQHRWAREGLGQGEACSPPLFLMLVSWIGLHTFRARLQFPD